MIGLFKVQVINFIKKYSATNNASSAMKPALRPMFTTHTKWRLITHASTSKSLIFDPDNE